MARFAQAARDVAAGLGVVFDQENTHVQILTLRSLARNQVKKTAGAIPRLETGHPKSPCLYSNITLIALALYQQQNRLVL